MRNREEPFNLNTVLFLCTGNYYRSRFAELYFNAMSPTRGLGWRAESRGLRLNAVNPGPISRQTVAWLQNLQISLPPTHREPVQAAESDFQVANLVVAVKEAEHRPLMAILFPAWIDKVEYWHVHDQDCAGPEEALPDLVARVENLLDRLMT